MSGEASNPSSDSIPAAVESTLAAESKTVITTIPLTDPAAAHVTHEQLEILRSKFQDELDSLNQQITLLQVKATALEAQLNSIEPKMEARASRTEKLVAELQIEIVRMMKTMAAKDKVENATLSAVQEMKGMLETLVKRP